ncbi:MAG: hypothetical protein MUF23_11120 [Pirellula sp.]|nr:hypothetical protein [Pirellula sp.]
MHRTLVGKPAKVVRDWAAWYLERCKLGELTVDQLLREADREQGTHAGVTMTKIRRAASRLAARRATS